jgi:hypothetical protein
MRRANLDKLMAQPKIDCLNHVREHEPHERESPGVEERQLSKQP